MRIAVLLLVLAAAAQQAVAQDSELPVDPHSGLPMDTGWELVRAHCSACHSLQLVTAQRATRRGWLEIIRWMQETQNLWQFDPQTENTILDYLAKHYPPVAHQRRMPIPVHLMPGPECDIASE